MVFQHFYNQEVHFTDNFHATILFCIISLNETKNLLTS